jgi:hypothetical protein
MQNSTLRIQTVSDPLPPGEMAGAFQLVARDELVSAFRILHSAFQGSAE